MRDNVKIIINFYTYQKYLKFKAFDSIKYYLILFLFWWFIIEHFVFITLFKLRKNGKCLNIFILRDKLLKYLYFKNIFLYLKINKSVYV